MSVVYTKMCEEEVNVSLCLWQFVQMLEIKPIRKHWVHPINQKRDISSFINELKLDLCKFYNYCRMSVTSFEVLLGLLTEKLTKLDTNCRRSITAEERLFITLRFLATGDRFQNIHYNFRIGATTAGKIVAETCACIWEVLSPMNMMTEPTPEKWALVAERFEELWNFPNCCGPIDGKHIHIEGPWNCGSAYYNYKNYHSIVLQAVVDAEGNFLIVDVGAPGRNNDAGVFLASNFGRRFIDKNLNLPVPRMLYPDKNVLFPYVFVADEAYALAINMMKPFARTALLNNERKIFNYRLSRARRIVECAFGMLVKKFRVLEQTMLVHPDLTKSIVLSCCVLHNFIRKREGKLAEVYDELMNIAADEQQHLSTARSSKAAYKVRHTYLEYFTSPTGAVSWQEKMAFCT